MCGIIGYIGKKDAEKIIIEGLHALEYRGYDSAGLAIRADDGSIVSVRCGGRVSELEEKATLAVLSGKSGIGHTRWATHGAPTEANSHPHSSHHVTVVHNGIIDNCLDIRRTLEENGYSFISETDTECIAHLIDREYVKTHDAAKAIYSACSLLRGSYAIAVMFSDIPDKIWAIRKDSPLILAIAEDGCYTASDIPAILPHSREIIRPEEGELFCTTAEGIYSVFGDGTMEKAKTEHFDLDVGAAKKDGYDYFMLKEIHEEPDAVRRVCMRRINEAGLPDFSADGIGDELWKSIDSIQIIGCGSATHAGFVGRSLIEKLAGIPVTVNTASEYRYDPPATVGRTLAMPISQSGETADTLAGLRLAKANGLVTASIVNAVGSAAARESDYVMYTGAGPEIAVATTKGYTTQVALLCMIAIKLALVRGRVGEDFARKFCHDIAHGAPEAIANIIARQDEIRDIAKSIYTHEDIYFIGRGPDYHSGHECSLKLKEISYIHSESYAAGELKHGTLSLVEDGTPVIALATGQRYYDKMTGNIREVRARGGYSVLVCGRDFPEPASYGEKIFMLPGISEYFSPLATVVFSQILAYETAILRGCDVDHPRNLAKSVTVE